MRIRDLLTLTPFLLSDGGVSPKGKSGWLIYFRNNDKELTNRFVTILNRVTKNKIQIQKRQDCSYMVRVNDKALGNKLHILCGSFRTRPCTIHPKCPNIKNGRCNISTEDGHHKIILPNEIFENYNLRRLFLQVYFTCDGGVSVTTSKGKYPFLVRKVFVNIRHPTLRENIHKLLIAAEFNPHVYSDQIRLTIRKDIEKFLKEIRFVSGVKIGGDSKNFRGVEKNNLLRKVVASYENPKEFINTHFM